MVNQLVSPQLFTACKEGRVEDVVQLLSSGVGANVTDRVSKVCVQVWVQICMHGCRQSIYMYFFLQYGDTPLHIACLLGHSALVQTLLQSGADHSIQNKVL